MVLRDCPTTMHSVSKASDARSSKDRNSSSIASSVGKLEYEKGGGSGGGGGGYGGVVWPGEHTSQTIEAKGMRCTSNGMIMHASCRDAENTRASSRCSSWRKSTRTRMRFRRYCLGFSSIPLPQRSFIFTRQCRRVFFCYWDMQKAGRGNGRRENPYKAQQSHQQAASRGMVLVTAVAAVATTFFVTMRARAVWDSLTMHRGSVTRTRMEVGVLFGGCG